MRTNVLGNDEEERYIMTFTAVPKPPKKSKLKKEEMASNKSSAAKKEPKHLSRDEFELEELAITLNEAKEESKLKVFTIYKEDEPLEGIITKMDANTKLIHIKDKFMDVHKVHFLDILKVSDTEN